MLRSKAFHGNCASVLFAEAPQSLQGRAECSRLRRNRHLHRKVQNISCNLPPHCAFCSAASKAQFLRLESVLLERLKPAPHGIHGAFKSRARNIRPAAVRSCQPGDARFSVRKVRSPFPVKERKHNHSAAARLSLFRLFIKFLYIKPQKRPDLLRSDRAVHCA